MEVTRGRARGCSMNQTSDGSYKFGINSSGWTQPEGSDAESVPVSTKRRPIQWVRTDARGDEVGLILTREHPTVRRQCDLSVSNACDPNSKVYDRLVAVRVLTAQVLGIQTIKEYLKFEHRYRNSRHPSLITTGMAGCL